MLYLADKKAKLFKGDYKPVGLYLGNKKVTGYEYAEQTGEYLTFENTYNDSAYLKIIGNTLEIGEGEKSPDNPYELKSVGDDGGFDLVSAGRNLIPPFTNDYTVTFQGVTMSVLKGGQSVKVDGEFTGSSPGGRIVLRSVAGRIKLEGGVTYTFSAHHIGGTYSRMSAYLNRVSNNTFIASADFKGTGVQITPSEDTECYIGIVLSVDAKCEDAEFVFQIERGFSTSPYTPFRGAQTVHMPYTLRSLPDGTCDYIEVDNVQKRAWYYQLTGEKVLDGTENWQKYREPLWTENKIGVALYSITPKATASTGELCTHFHRALVTGEPGFVATANGFRAISSGFYFAITISGITDIESWQSFLAAQHAAGTPVIVIYKLAEPIITELDYNAVKTYYPYTQIYTTATVQPTLEAKIRVWEA